MSGCERDGAAAREAFSGAVQRLDQAHRHVTWDDRVVFAGTASAIYADAVALALAQGKTVTYGMLANSVLRTEGKGDFGNVRTTVKRLRRKLGEDLTNPVYVLTESGVGYRLHSRFEDVSVG